MRSDDPNFFDTRAKTYVRYVLDEMQLSPSALAKMSGLATTTLTRALNDPDHKYTFSMSTLGKISKATGVNFNPFFEPDDYPALSMMPYEAPNLYDESWGVGANATTRDEPNDAQYALVIGDAAVGIWKEERIGRLEDWGALPVTLPKTTGVEAFGLKISDDSNSPFLLKNEYAICRRRRATDKLRHGDLVVVERWKSSPRMMEFSVRRLIAKPGEPPHLRCENREKFPDIIIPRPDLENTDDVKIVGLVQAAVREVSDVALEDEHRNAVLDARFGKK